VRNWRILTAVLAVVLAVAAGALVWKYTDDAKTEAKKPFQLETVLVASQRVPIGTSLTAALDGGLIGRAERVRNDLPQGAIVGTTTDAELKTLFANKVASHDIVTDATITSGDFVAPNVLPNGLAGQLETDGKNDGRHVEAVSVRLDEDSSVGGFLKPGDSVNIWSVPTPDHTFDQQITSWLLPGVKVLAVGSETAAPEATTSSKDGDTSASTSTVSRTMITLEVTTEQAQQVIQAQTIGKIYLTLNPPSFQPGDFSNPEEVVEVLNLYRNADGGRRNFPVLDEWLRDPRSKKG